MGWLRRGVQCTAVLGQCEHACVGAERSEDGAAAGAYVEATPKGVLSIHRRRGGELDREGTGHGHVAAGVCQCTTPTRLGARTVG
jgi:hypothetical protein